MYFQNRTQAGQLLAAELQHLRYENCVIIALSDGGVIIGEYIAAAIHAPLMMLITEKIEVPGEQMSFGTVDQEGNFVHNPDFSDSEYEYYYGEFRGYLDEQKRVKFERINELLGDGGILDKAILWNQTVILVSDGMKDGSEISAASTFLKPIKTEAIICATTLASVQAVDRMHAIADELHVLRVTDNYLDTDHYYDDNELPSHEDLIERINRSILNWR